MNLIAVNNEEEMSIVGATIIAAQILKKPTSVLGLATGTTPVRTYELLQEKYKAGVLDFSKAKSFNLDEYCGLSQDHKQSYYYFMQEKLFKHINMPAQNINLPKGNTADHNKQCSDYDAKIQEAGGIDLQLLGIGSNGHVGFNEPNTEFVIPTHVETLAQSTIKDNSRMFSDNETVPTQAISMGIGTINMAKSIILLAGNGKQEIIKKMISSNVNPQLPASILHFHKDCTIVYVK